MQPANVIILPSEYDISTAVLPIYRLEAQQRIKQAVAEPGQRSGRQIVFGTFYLKK